jgi:hypothetical protein
VCRTGGESVWEDKNLIYSNSVPSQLTNLGLQLVKTSGPVSVDTRGEESVPSESPLAAEWLEYEAFGRANPMETAANTRKPLINDEPLWMFIQLSCSRDFTYIKINSIQKWQVLNVI